MCVDSQGRAWVGSFGYDLYAGERARGATLMRVDPDGTVIAVAEDLHFPNSIIVAPGEDTVLVAETIAARISAFDLSPDGALSNRRVYAQIAPTPPLAEIDAEYTSVGYGPDGCTLDAEGCLWCGDSLHQRVARIAPGGEIVEELATPEAALRRPRLAAGDGRRRAASLALHGARRGTPPRRQPLAWRFPPTRPGAIRHSHKKGAARRRPLCWCLGASAGFSRRVGQSPAP